MTSYWKHGHKVYECDDFIPNKDFVLRPAYYPYDDNCILVPKGMCDGNFTQISITEYHELLKWYINYDGVLITEVDGTRSLKDEGNLPFDYDEVHSGYSVEVSGDGKIEVPINATLGSAITVPNASSFDTGVTINGKELQYDGTGTASTGRYQGVVTPNKEANYAVEIVSSFSAVGTVVFINGSRVEKIPLKNGTHTYTVKASSDTTEDRLWVAFEAHTAIGTIEVISFKEITAVKGSVTIFDHATKTFTQPTLPLASTYTLKDGTFGTIIKLDTNTFSQADLTAFTARPELVTDWFDGTKTIPSGITKQNGDVLTLQPTATGTNTVSNTSDYGIQTIALGNAPMNGGNDGRYVTIPLRTPKKLLVTKDIDTIQGDNFKVTVNYSDGTHEIIKA